MNEPSLDDQFLRPLWTFDTVNNKKSRPIFHSWKSTIGKVCHDALGAHASAAHSAAISRFPCNECPSIFFSIRHVIWSIPVPSLWWEAGGSHMSGAGGNLTFWLQLASQICAMYPVLFTRIDSSCMVSIRPFVALCPHFSSPAWPLPQEARYTGGASRIGPIRWYTTLGERINVLERIQGKESMEGTCPAGTMFREALAHWRTCLRDFSPGNTESDKPLLWVIHVENFRPSPPCKFRPSPPC